MIFSLFNNNIKKCSAKINKEKDFFDENFINEYFIG